MGTDKPFLSDIQEIRRRARRHVEQGAVTDAYGADRSVAVRLLNEALATEIVCTLRYKRHYYMAQGIHSRPIADEFLEHANEEQRHADLLAERIVELNGEPDFDPRGLATRSHAEYVAGDSLVSMLHEDLVAERIAIESYTELIRWFGDRDPTSRRLMEKILANEEEHAEELNDLLRSLSAAEGGTATAGEHVHEDEDELDLAERRASEEPRDLGFGASHGYPAGRGGPTSPGDVPAPR